MRKLLPPLFLILLTALCLPTQAQDVSGPYTLKLKNGNIPIQKNIEAVKSGQLQAQTQDVFDGRAYFILQFNEIPTATQRAAIHNMGIELLSYIPNKAYLASLPNTLNPADLENLDVRAVMRPGKQYRLSPALFNANYPVHALHNTAIDLRISLAKDVDREQAITALTSEGATIEQKLTQNLLDIRLPISELNDLAALPYLAYIDAVPERGTPDDIRGRSLHRSNAINTDYSAGRKYDGTGVTVSLADDGFIGPHIDYTGRLAQFAIDNDGTHGDMTAGIMFGAGNRDPAIRGHATGAFMHYFDIFDYLNFPDYPHVIFGDSLHDNHGIVVTSTSYSQGQGGVYTTDTEFIDNQVYTNSDLIHVFSAGNAGNNWRTITGGYKAGKNVMTCGNLSAYGILENSSSRGPTEDGRIKPDICANGIDQLSTLDPNLNQVGGGTSAAAPSIAGITTQLYHAYKVHNNGNNPESPLIKGIMLNSAEDLGVRGPDFEHGWGRVNALRAARMIENNQYMSASVDQGATNTHQVYVPAGLGEVKIMVYWLDDAGDPAVTLDLVNDLDMTITDPSGTTYSPWVLNPNNPGAIATTGVESLNNMEQVVVATPMGGSYTVTINGTSVPQGPQTYYVVYTYIEQQVELTYPIGGEGFRPGTDELLRWEAYGTSGNFLLEYSTNNGASWLNITTQSGGVRQYQWTVPPTVSGECWIRIDNGGNIDMSDEAFVIVPTPDNLTVDYVCPNSIGISWDPVIGAVEYEVSMLGAMYMDSIARVTSPNHVITGLNPSDVHWFAVRAVTASGGVGRQAVAVETPGATLNCTVPTDGAVASIDAPSSGTYPSCITSATTPVSITVTNFGQNALVNVPVRMQVNNGVVANETMSGTILPGASTTYTFTATANLSTTGNYDIKTWTAVAGDGNTLNDSIIIPITVVGGNANTLPFNEDFESFSACGNANNCGGTICALSNGWINWANGTEDVHDWRTDAGGTPSNNTGPSTDHNPGNSSGNYLFLEASAGCDNAEADLLTPCLDLTGAAAPQLSFWYHMFGGNMGELHVDVYSNGSWDLDVFPTQIGNMGNVWRQGFVNLAPYSGQTVVVRFRGITGGGFEGDMAIDDISVTNATALPSADFQANTVLCAGASSLFSDLSSNAPNSWAWTFAPNTVTYINGTSASSQHPEVQFMAPGQYTVTLVSTNGFGSDTETKTNYVNVSSGSAIPIAEDFESFNNCSTADNCGSTVCGLGNGWINATNGSEDGIDWRVDNGGTPSNNTGPGVDHNPGTGGGNYVYLEASNGCNFQEAQLISPCLDLTSATLPTLSFWYHMFGAGMGELHVDAFVNNVWSLDIVPMISGDQGNQWVEGVVDLSAYAGQTIQVRFRGITGGTFASDMALDDISITNSTVVPQADFLANRVGICVGDQVDFTDLTTGLPASWAWNITPSTGVSYVNGTSATSQHPSVQFNVAGSYTIELVASNGNGSSTQTQTGYITVSASSPLPFSEDFQGAAFAPSGWDILDAGGALTWVSDVVPGAGGGNSTVAKMENFTYPSIAAEDRLLTKPITLPGNSCIWMSFDVAHARKDLSFQDGLRIDISTDCGATWSSSGYMKSGSDLSTVADQTSAFTPSGANDWRKDSIDLTSFSGSDVVIAFVGINGYGNNLYVDNLNITSATLQTPAAAFTYPSTVCAGEMVTFSDATNNCPTSWNWTFGNGNPGTATGNGPHTVSFATAGTYTISLTAANAAGSNTTNQTITVMPAPTPTVSISQTGGPTPACHEEQLTFTATGTNTGSNPVYEWKVNGAVVGTGTTYSAALFYNLDQITCELTSDAMCAAPMTVVSNLLEADISGAAPVADFSYTNSGGTFDFTDLSTWSPTQWAWDFGDGSTSTTQNPTHTFNGGGAFSVTLIASNSCGSDTFMISITGRAPELADESLVNVYPNPSGGIFHLTLAQSQASSVVWTITDLQGRILMNDERKLVNGGMQASLDLSAFSKGMYLLRMETHEGVYVRKLILK